MEETNKKDELKIRFLNDFIKVLNLYAELGIKEYKQTTAFIIKYHQDLLQILTKFNDLEKIDYLLSEKKLYSNKVIKAKITRNTYERSIYKAIVELIDAVLNQQIEYMEVSKKAIGLNAYPESGKLPNLLSKPEITTDIIPVIDSPSDITTETPTPTVKSNQRKS